MAVQLGACDLPVLMTFLHEYLPETLPIYFTADNVIRGLLTTAEVHFGVDTWPSPSCVVAVSPAHEGQLCNYRTTIDVWTNDPREVESVLHDSELVDWTQPIFFRVLGETGIHQVQELVDKSSDTSSCVQRNIYALGSLPQKKEAPPGFNLLTLSQKDAQIVGLQYSAWGVKPADTVHYFQRCSLLLPSSCLQTLDGQLVAYVALHHTSAFGSVFTDPNYRQRGFGQIVVADICAKMTADGQTPYVFVNPENIASIKLYEKCGFQLKGVAYRIRYTPLQKQ